MKKAQTRLATVGAKYGLSGDVSQSAATDRRSTPLVSGRSPPKYFGGTTAPPTGCLVEPPRRSNTTIDRGSPPRLRPTWQKNAANP